MNRLVTTLAIIFLLCSENLFGQKLEYETTSPWFWGMNVGAAWNTTDVKNKTYGGWGIIVGRSLGMDYGNALSFDIRGRYLGGVWRGQDLDSTSANDFPENYTGAQNVYLDSVGYSVNNFQNRTHELDLELAIHLNRLTGKTGWDPYLFGGIGVTWNRAKANFYNFDEVFGNELYDYQNLPELSKSEIDLLHDGSYETLLNSSEDTYFASIMPSVGVGLGYYLGKRFSMGIEHKTTFTLRDDYDGYVQPEGKYENDMYHYTSAYFRYHFRIGEEHSSSTTTNNPNTTTNSYNNDCQEPIIKFTSPRVTNKTVANASFTFSANVAHVSSRNNIEVVINGNQSSNFVYDGRTKKLEASTLLHSGKNTIVIVAQNQCGRSSQSIVVNYQPNCDDPLIISKFPTQSGVATSQSTIRYDADVYNFTTNSSLTFKVNNRIVSNYSFDPNTGKFICTVQLENGTNKIELMVANNCGTSVESLTVNYITNCKYPTVNLVAPTQEEETNQDTYTVYAVVKNVNSASQISLKVNGVTQGGGHYNANNHTFKKQVHLQAHRNSVEVIATNDCGNISQLHYVTYTPEEESTYPPIIGITTACNATVDAGNHYVAGNISNVTSLNQVHFELNGVVISNFNPVFTAEGLNFGFNIHAEQSPGSYTLVITAQNEVGFDRKICNITVNEPEEQEYMTICARVGSSWETMQITEEEWPQYQADGARIGPCPETEEEEEKITICHYPPGNTDNPQEIEIALSAWPAHQAHGDKLGPCPDVEEEEDSEEAEKITICHYPPGNTDNPQQIEISLFAWPAHQAHGDKLGPCEEEETEDEGSEEEKVVICHYPPGNQSNPQQLEISISAWPAHQAHGDKLGPCPEEEEEEKITICHYPPGNTDNPQQIDIPLSAWSAHQAHGDKLGACPEVTEEEGTMTICLPRGKTQETKEIETKDWPRYKRMGASIGACPEIEEENEPTMTICLKRGNKSQTLEIKQSEWEKYQRMGAAVGACPESDTEVNEEEGDNEQETNSSNMITICVEKNGTPTTMEIQENEWRKYKRMGATLGACSESDGLNKKEKNVTICITGKKGSKITKVIPESDWPRYKRMGAKLGSCITEGVSQKDKKITICVILRGKPTTKIISAKDWPKYKRMGAKIGKCPKSPTIEKETIDKGSAPPRQGGRR